MKKNSKRKLLFTTILLAALLISSVYAALIPSTNAAEVSPKQKGVSILSNVVGLDLTKYDVTTEYQQDAQSSYLDVIPQTTVGFDLTSSESKLKILYTFANGNLQMMHVLENEGSPRTTLSVTNARELAQSFLSNYQAYTQDSVYGELRSTLDNVDASKNSTRTSENTQLEVSTIDGYTKFKWTYTFNGIIAPSKFVAIGINNGFLMAFVDNWQLYKIGSTSLTLTKNEAVAIALETGKAHFGDMKLIADTLDETTFNASNVRWTSLIFDSSLGADKTRSEDLLMLYPVWRVGVALDKWYGQLYGIEVDVWADSSLVRRAQEAWSTLPPPEGVPTANMNDQASVSEAMPNLAMLICFPTVALTALGAALLWISQKKKALLHSLLKPRFLKAVGILLCVLISSALLLGATATANATTRAGVIWGSESNEAIDLVTGESWLMLGVHMRKRKLVKLVFAQFLHFFSLSHGSTAFLTAHAVRTLKTFTPSHPFKRLTCLPSISASVFPLHLRREPRTVQQPLDGA